MAQDSRRGAPQISGPGPPPFPPPEADPRLLPCSALLCPAVLFYDLPPPLVCARCRGRLPRTEPRRCRLDARPADSDPELAPWMDRRVHGLWQQETPTWLQPLCRLSSLAAAGWK